MGESTYRLRRRGCSRRGFSVPRPGRFIPETCSRLQVSEIGVFLLGVKCAVLWKLPRHRAVAQDGERSENWFSAWHEEQASGMKMRSAQHNNSCGQRGAAKPAARRGSSCPLNMRTRRSSIESDVSQGGIMDSKKEVKKSVVVRLPALSGGMKLVKPGAKK